MQRVKVSVQDHRAEECKGIRIIDPRTRKAVPQYDAICARIWLTLTERERLNFHRGTCLDQMSPYIRNTMQLVVRKLREAGIR